MILLSFSAVAQEPPDCSARFAKQWREHREKLVALRSNQPGYVPFPYPTSDKQIRENIRFDYMRMHGGEHGRPPRMERERQLYGLIRADTFEMEVLTVENWTEGRCLPMREESFFYIVRILEPAHREEVARMEVNQKGSLTTWDFSSGLPSDVVEKWRRQVPRPESVIASVAGRFGVGAQRPRYIYTLMEDGRCFHLRPCVLLSGAGGRGFLFVPWLPFAAEGELYSFDQQSPRIPLPEVRERALQGVQSGPYPGQLTMSIGAEESIVLTAVPPKTEE
jgi:hypothetical protein